MFNRIKNINLKDVFGALFSKESPLYVKGILIFALLYVISPIDLIPDVLGVIGWVDDVAVVTGLVSLAMNLLERHQLSHSQYSSANDSDRPSRKPKDVTHSVKD